MNGWHLTLRSGCAQGGWSRPRSRGFCGRGLCYRGGRGGRSTVVVSPLSPAEVERCPPPPPNLSWSEGDLLCSLTVKASVTVFLLTRGGAEWNAQELVFQAALQGPNLC